MMRKKKAASTRIRTLIRCFLGCTAGILLYFLARTLSGSSSTLLKYDPVTSDWRWQPSILTQNFTLMTFNIRNKDLGESDPRNEWGERRSAVLKFFTSLDPAPDVIGTQEGVYEQLEDIRLATNDEYGWIGVARDDGLHEGHGEYSAIFYRRSTMVVVDNGNFWLGERPEAPGEIGRDTFGSQNRRLCTWALFSSTRPGLVSHLADGHTRRVSQQAETSKQLLYVYNLHMDFGDRIQLAAAVVWDYINVRSRPDVPYVLMGDFNTNYMRDLEVLDFFRGASEGSRKGTGPAPPGISDPLFWPLHSTSLDLPNSQVDSTQGLIGDGSRETLYMARRGDPSLGSFHYWTGSFFGPRPLGGPKVDYILCPPRAVSVLVAQVLQWPRSFFPVGWPSHPHPDVTIDRSSSLLFPSDHFPVYVALQLHTPSWK